MFSFQNMSLVPLLNPLSYVQDGLNRFHTFVHHPLFKKFPGEIQNAIDEFKSKNPKFIFPSNTGKVAGLVARIHDANKPHTRRMPGSVAGRGRPRTGVCSFPSFFLSFVHSLFLFSF